MTPNSRIILALDLINENDSLNLIRLLCGHLAMIKVGLPLILNTGLQIVRKIKKLCNIPIIADFKVMDIPATAVKNAEAAFNFGCDAIVICGASGPTAIADCMKLAKDKKIFVFLEFTHPDGLITVEMANKTAKIAKNLGVFGILAPGTKLERIKELREIIGNELIIACCGIGVQGPEPGSAIKAGANYEIIGRIIYEAVDPLQKVIKIKQKINELL